MDSIFWIGLLEVVWINIILSGDNAVVIALACKDLPDRQRLIGMIMGAGVAILLRVVFTLMVATLLDLPFLRLAGGALLVWIAIKLVTDEAGDDDHIRSSDQLWYAVRTVAIADAVMSLDNVLAIAAVARDSRFMLVLGLIISIPLIVAGASLIMKLLERLPILVWAGAALLGWLAGDMMLNDPVVKRAIGIDAVHRFELPTEVIGALFVIGVAYLIRRARPAAAA
ncbi:MAG: TerC family protein [Phreatobacter sp.]|uniref:TerC family protein n=1 Tax=Phreatobacter sp. TaxID=1966341 RepID=UPI001A5A5749|nr:TerC family protein [Phreatobacter sp.]MBL8570485.1 TerC family protein [Phreatobacter sp.]